MSRSLDGLAWLPLWLVVGCGPPGIVDATDADTSTSGGNTTSTDEETSTSGTPNDMSLEACGDGIVNGLEECEPSGPVSCADDCTLPPDGPGSIEWLFIDDEGGRAVAVAVDEEGRATVAGSHSVDDSPDEVWVGRFEADGTLAWEFDYSGDGASATAMDVGLTSNGDAILVGSIGFMDPNEWVAAYGDDGMPLWSWSGTIDDHGGIAEAVAVLADQIYVGVHVLTNGWESYPEIRLIPFSADGVPQMARTWVTDDNIHIESLAAEPGGGQLVLVGIWNDGNWVEALDANMDTLWTDNALVHVMPGGGPAAAHDVAVDLEGGIYVVGQETEYYDPPGPFPEHPIDFGYVRKLSASGEAGWVVLPSSFADPAITFADGTVYMADLDNSDQSSELMFQAFDATTGALQWRRHVSMPEGIDYAADLEASLDSLWAVGSRYGCEIAEDLQCAYVGRFRR